MLFTPTTRLTVRTVRGERDFWRHRGIDLFDAPLDTYLERLAGRINATAPALEVVA